MSRVADQRGAVAMADGSIISEVSLGTIGGLGAPESPDFRLERIRKYLMRNYPGTDHDSGRSLAKWRGFAWGWLDSQARGSILIDLRVAVATGGIGVLSRWRGAGVAVATWGRLACTVALGLDATVAVTA